MSMLKATRGVDTCRTRVAYYLFASAILCVTAANGLMTTPAQAFCLYNNTAREDIPTADCPEAQRTGCIKHMLTNQQYLACIAAQPSGCVMGGVVRRDIGPGDCAEAQQTGCVRHLLTPDQYQACLAAQPNRR